LLRDLSSANAIAEMLITNFDKIFEPIQDEEKLAGRKRADTGESLTSNTSTSSAEGLEDRRTSSEAVALLVNHGVSGKVSGSSSGNDSGVFLPFALENASNIADGVQYSPRGAGMSSESENEGIPHSLSQPELRMAAAAQLRTQAEPEEETIEESERSEASESEGESAAARKKSYSSETNAVSPMSSGEKMKKAKKGSKPERAGHRRSKSGEYHSSKGKDAIDLLSVAPTEGDDEKARDVTFGETTAKEPGLEKRVVGASPVLLAMLKEEQEAAEREKEQGKDSGKSTTRKDPKDRKLMRKGSLIAKIQDVRKVNTGKTVTREWERLKEAKEREKEKDKVKDKEKEKDVRRRRKLEDKMRQAKSPRGEKQSVDIIRIDAKDRKLERTLFPPESSSAASEQHKSKSSPTMEVVPPLALKAISAETIPTVSKLVSPRSRQQYSPTFVTQEVPAVPVKVVSPASKSLEAVSMERVNTNNTSEPESTAKSDASSPPLRKSSGQRSRENVQKIFAGQQPQQQQPDPSSSSSSEGDNGLPKPDIPKKKLSTSQSNRRSQSLSSSPVMSTSTDRGVVSPNFRVARRREVQVEAPKRSTHLSQLSLANEDLLNKAMEELFNPFSYAGWYADNLIFSFSPRSLYKILILSIQDRRRLQSRARARGPGLRHRRRQRARPAPA
jgi:hypothetical protein